MAQVIFHRRVTVKTQMGSRTSPRQRSVVHNVALGRVYLRVLRFFPATVIPPMLHTNLHVHAALMRRSNRRSLEIFRKQCSFGNGIILADVPLMAPVIIIIIIILPMPPIAVAGYRLVGPATVCLFQWSRPIAWLTEGQPYQYPGASVPFSS
jgi:hypothetical protein